MKKRSKRYRAMVEAVGAEALEAAHSVAEAVALLKKCNSAPKFDESVELAINLNIDTNKADQLVRGSFSLPNGTGKSVRVVAFAEGADAEAAKAAGAVEVGDEDLAKKISGGWFEFDVCVAHPSMMKHVGKLGKVLGPKGLMPSPKSGTVTPNVADAVKEFAAGKIEFRNDKFGNVSISVGKISFDEDKIVENVNAILGHINGLRPSTVKGHYMNGVTISTTMGIGLKVAV